MEEEEETEKNRFVLKSPNKRTPTIQSNSEAFVPPNDFQLFQLHFVFSTSEFLCFVYYKLIHYSIMAFEEVFSFDAAKRKQSQSQPWRLDLNFTSKIET